MGAWVKVVSHKQSIGSSMTKFEEDSKTNDNDYIMAALAAAMVREVVAAIVVKGFILEQVAMVADTVKDGGCHSDNWGSNTAGDEVAEATAMVVSAMLPLQHLQLQI
ncbi:hypothetical protein Acr_04g0004040 [Actinidia rufa]|uniref:Uncharacterized protein n=1 Tax=Actinidia rufa TaxID=165716 RepID=A0A7J0EHK1_9ERIC|nr:hypothetical protein Acr_04g0004040 [Actinidia rufa]